MLESIAPGIWHLQHRFVTSGVQVSSRMTVIRLHDGALWLHSPVPLSVEVIGQLSRLGDVRYIVAPNKMHHLFLSETIAVFPNAKLFGAPGLRKKRPDLPALIELQSTVEPEWAEDLCQTFFDGMPIGNETVWFHKPSRTLLVTDLCQWWKGTLSFSARTYAALTGVRQELAVPRTVRMMIKDRAAARASAEKMLAYPFERIVLAHNVIIDSGAHAAVKKAFACLGVRQVGQSTMNPEIRKEVPADEDAIDAVTTAAFLSAPHTAHTEQFIVKALRRAGKLTISLVAEIGGEVVGHVAVSPVGISDGTSGWYGLGPISVAPPYQGQGIGSLLVRGALRALRDREASGCVVLGEPGYYGRFGFRAEPGLVLPAVPPEYFQAISFDAAVPGGTVSYDESFNARAWPDTGEGAVP